METTGRKILLVDDDPTLRAALTETLAGAGYEVVAAPDGKAGQQLFIQHDFALILSDIRMPLLNGVELLKFVRKIKATPFILMTAFSDLCEAREASELGADAFLAKPFLRDELLKRIAECLTKKPPAPAVDVKDQYCKLNIEDFTTGRLLHFDIHLRISDQKFIKIAHGGEDLPIERIQSYKSKNLKYLYMRKDDFKKYVGFNVLLTRSSGGSPRISAEKKAQLLKHTGEIISQLIRLEGIDEESYEYAKTFVENSLGVLGDQDEAFNLIALLSSHTDFLYAHSVGVSMVGVLLAREMRWGSISNLFKIALGGLLHDIGKKEIIPAVLQKARKDLTAEEIKLIETHTVRGGEILGQLKSVPDDVAHIVLQHHEDCVGQGYPKGLRRNRIHPLARLVSVANEFCNLTLRTPGGPELKPHEAIARLLEFSRHKLDPDFLQALAALFGQKTPR